MWKDYIVVFQNMKTGKCDMDIFCSMSEAETKIAFKESPIYRHGNYKILAVIERPEINNVEEN